MVGRINTGTLHVRIHEIITAIGMQVKTLGDTMDARFLMMSHLPKRSLLHSWNWIAIFQLCNPQEVQCTVRGGLSAGPFEDWFIGRRDNVLASVNRVGLMAKVDAYHTKVQLQ